MEDRGKAGTKSDRDVRVLTCTSIFHEYGAYI